MEEDYQAAEAHMRAIAALAAERLTTMPSFLWLFVVWADLRLTAVSFRASVLPFVLHPDFHVHIPKHIGVRVRALASFNARFLPRGAVFLREMAVEVLEKLYTYTAIYNEDDADWMAAWSVSYQAAYLLAKMQSQVHAARHNKDRHSCDIVQLTLLAARIQFWGIASPFVPQDGLQQYLLYEFMETVSHWTPNEIHGQWDAAGCIDSLLWVLFSASASAVQQFKTGRSPPVSALIWICTSLKLMLKHLELCTVAQFEKYLRRWPFAEDWNGSMYRFVFNWAHEEVIPATSTGHSPSRWWREFRLTFDAAEE